jgi:hypothetical protein
VTCLFELYAVSYGNPDAGQLINKLLIVSLYNFWILKEIPYFTPLFPYNKTSIGTKSLRVNPKNHPTPLENKELKKFRGGKKSFEEFNNKFEAVKINST